MKEGEPEAKEQLHNITINTIKVITLTIYNHVTYLFIVIYEDYNESTVDTGFLLEGFKETKLRVKATKK